MYPSRVAKVQYNLCGLKCHALPGFLRMTEHPVPETKTGPASKWCLVEHHSPAGPWKRTNRQVHQGFRSEPQESTWSTIPVFESQRTLSPLPGMPAVADSMRTHTPPASPAFLETVTWV